MANGTWNTCYKCKQTMWIPEALETAALAARGQVPFFCAYGHRQFYLEGESEVGKLRRERDRLAQQIAQRDDEITRQRELREAAERSASAVRGQMTKLKRRTANGVCPCCTRSFVNLRRHIETKHPDFGADNVVALKAVGGTHA